MEAKNTGEVSSADTLKKEVKVVNIKELLAMGDISHGEKVFKKCSACHMIVSGGKNMIGPNLWGVIGRMQLLSQIIIIPRL